MLLESYHQEKHPDADRLNLTTVNVGTENLLQIVSGAPNVAAGQKVIVAMVGAKVIYQQKESRLEIKIKNKRSFVSEGMWLCRRRNRLDISHNDGIMILPSETKVGMLPPRDYFKVEKI